MALTDDRYLLASPERVSPFLTVIRRAVDFGLVLDEVDETRGLVVVFFTTDVLFGLVLVVGLRVVVPVVRVVETGGGVSCTWLGKGVVFEATRSESTSDTGGGE